ncbi:hypothetical protein N2152v2_011081 [Parachlorella kessleri]
MAPRRAWVMVLGDVGRSPRMQYHTVSLCSTPGYHVTLVGYRGSELIQGLQKAEAEGRLAVGYIPDLPRWVARLPSLLRLIFKALAQLLALLYMILFSLPRPDVILLQLPPAIPTMLVCRLAAARHRARLVFDWHNFAYTLMAINMGRGHPLVRLAERYERYWAHAAQANLCVTKAMGRELQQRWGLSAGVTVFYDRPPDFFRPATLQEKHQLLAKLHPVLSAPLHPADFAAELAAGSQPPPPCAPAAEGAPAADEGSSEDHTAEHSTLCTVREPSGHVVLRPDRPVLVVSSTSWTPDEDFGLLLRAAELYDAKARRSRQPYPRLLFLVTGRGPQRQQYEARMRALDLRHVAFRTLWLEPGDYPRLLGSADLGVSLHASSSGMDLPMKVVDMFGCGLPVCALSYPCIGELVSHEHNGLLFATPEQLAQQLLDLFRGFPARKPHLEIPGHPQQQQGSVGGGGGADLSPAGDGSSGLLGRLRRGVREAGLARWDESWRQVVLPLLEP